MWLQGDNRHVGRPERTPSYLNTNISSLNDDGRCNFLIQMDVQRDWIITVTSTTSLRRLRLRPDTTDSTIPVTSRRAEWEVKEYTANENGVQTPKIATVFSCSCSSELLRLAVRPSWLCATRKYFPLFEVVFKLFLLDTCPELSAQKRSASQHAIWYQNEPVSDNVQRNFDN